MRRVGTVTTLGVLPPDLHNDLQAQISQLEALQQQVLSDVILTGRQGADITQHKVRVDALSNDISILKAEIDQMDEGVVPQWKSQAAALYSTAMAQLQELADLRQKTETRGAYSGLLWGLGAAAVVAGIGYGVWRYRRK